VFGNVHDESLLISVSKFFFIGPVLMTVGPWRPISLHTYQNRISDLYVKSTVSEDLAVNVDVHLTLFEKHPAVASITLKSSDPPYLVVKSDNIKVADGQAVINLKLSKGDVDLWYPVGYGKQPLYTVEIEVAHEVRILFYRFSSASRIFC
jgi:beta-mannosidase